MKNIKIIICSLIILLTLCSCGKSDAVKAVEKAIDSIGTVTIDSGDALTNAKELYDVLSEEDKDAVDNIDVLTQALEQYDEVVLESIIPLTDILYKIAEASTIFDIKSAYEYLVEYSNLYETLPQVSIDLLYEKLDSETLETVANLTYVLFNSCIHNTYIAYPEYVVSVAVEGSWIVDDSTDVYTYNCWISNENDLPTAYADFKNYVSKYTDVVSTGNSFYFFDNSGEKIEVRMSSSILQVRMPPY